MLCGSLSRIAVGAMPFLLPMMLQLGFGLSAVHSGLITFVSSVGSLAMRLAAPVFLRRQGFRSVLVWMGLVATLLLASSAAFRPSWPVAAIYGVLLLNGFFQSLQFMAYNTIAYADVATTGHEYSHQFLYDLPADVVDAGHCDFGGGARGVGARVGSPAAAAVGFFRRVPGGCAGFRWRRRC